MRLIADRPSLPPLLQMSFVRIAHRCMTWAFVLCAGFATSNLVFAADAQPEWKVKNMGATINSAYQDGWATITGDGLTLYFSSNRPGGFSEAKLEDGWYLGKDGTPTRYDIYVSHRAKRSSPWGKPKLLSKGVNSTSSEHSALQSDDGHWLFFASDRPGGCGGLDIYVSHRANTKDDMAWGEPRNLGCEKDGGPNGPGIDSCPNFDNKGNLYWTSAKDDDPANIDFKGTTFDVKTGRASMGKTLPNSTAFMDAHIDPVHGYVWGAYPNSMGGSDIYKFENSERQRDPTKWTNPVLLPAPINSAFEDQVPAPTHDGKVVTFASDRPGGKGGLDIYEAVRIPKRPTRSTP
ncbi:hypothetical protein [Variovorax sp. EBFNA2]|uniref:hypothetical protein n=1 Tax=Variovorax sp. EBFNA2 TaxID=3342097 RepID=UPI0029C0CA6E|nr:hypothetical protein [Variovorax boronicumulans]WPG41240.1 hypothetical protein RZE79_30455 [Variovorax boronicumulans]